MLTIQDFALYLGAPFQVTLPSGDVQRFPEIAGVSIFGYISDGDRMFFNPALCKPILRPLSSLTEAEARELYALCGEEWQEAHPDNSDCLGCWWNEWDTDSDRKADLYIGDSLRWRWLLARHFDLFGWIESGDCLNAE